MSTVQILCDNNIGRMDFMGEHGFAALIEHRDKTYLLDTGQGLTLPHNVKNGDVDLQTIEAILLSHGHFDHTGGLSWVLEQTGSKSVIAHPGVFAEHMARTDVNPLTAPRYVGPPKSQSVYEAEGAEFEFKQKTEEITPGFHFITGYERRPELTPGDKKLLLPEGKDYIADPIAEDANLLLETDSGPVLVLGCAHGGVLNIMAHIEEKFGIKQLHAVLGGTHLMFYEPEQIQKVIETFEELDVMVVGVSHCTGHQAGMMLAHHFKDRFHQAAAGNIFVF